MFIAGSLPLTLKPLLLDAFADGFKWSVKSHALALNMPAHLVSIPHPLLIGAHVHLRSMLNGKR